MKKRSKLIEFLCKIFRHKSVYDEEESNRLKRKMCVAARREALCQGNCSYCAWEIK